MRTLFVQPTGDKQGHFGIWTVRLCQHLAELGHEVTLCTNSVRPERFLQEAPRFEVVEAEQGRYAFEDFDSAHLASPLRYYAAYFRNSYVIPRAALRLCSERPFDVVFVSDTEFMTVSMLLRTWRRPLPPVVVQLHAANFSLRYPGSPAKKIYKVVQREVFRRSVGRRIRALTVLGEWHREEIRRQLRLPDEFPVEVVPDAGEVSPKVIDRGEARRRIAIDYEGPVLLFFGVLRKDKGLERLLEAVALCADDDFRLLVAGAPMDYSADWLRAEVDRLSLQHRVLLRVGYVAEEDVPFYFGSADALVMPYVRNYSGGSGPLMKGACTYGTPVIASHVAEMGRLVEREGLGLTSPPDSPRELAATVREFLALDLRARTKMGENGRRLAVESSWSVVAGKLADFLAKVSEAQPAGRP